MFTAAFKARVAMEALRGNRTVQNIAPRHELHPNKVSQRKHTASERLTELFERSAGTSPGQKGDGMMMSEH